MTLSFGISGERKAEKFLIGKGYEILARNYRCRFGEIDLIAAKNGVTVFVEVKARKGGAYGMGYEAVNAKKQQKLILTAQHFFAERTETPARFDVISIDGGRITHIVNAFGV